MGISNVEVECGFIPVIKILMDRRESNKIHLLLIVSCRSLIRQFRGVLLRHVYHEANNVVDALAKHEATLQDDFVIFNDVPAFCFPFVAHDRASLCVPD
ncbi:hypothetical protein SLA2020_509470 [Shorea laevis]